MKVKRIKSMICGGMAVWLVMQPILAQGFVATLPSEIVQVKYPTDFQALIDEVSVCLLEAESEWYSESVQAKLPKIKHDEKRSCREILEAKEFSHNLRYEIDYSQSVEEGRVSIPKHKQEVLSLLSTSSELDGKQFQSTETLEIAMRLFIELNASFEADYELIHQENDILDLLYLRLYNLAYELPKVQGHPIFSEFMKDIRDSYLNVRASKFFRALVYYAYRENPDKELFETLARYWVHIEEAERQGQMSVYIPDEDQPLYSDVENVTPPIPDSQEIAFGDLENAWEEEREEVLKEELTEHRNEVVVNQNKPVNQEVQTTYSVENDQCIKQIQIYQQSKLVSTEKIEVNKDEYYRCGFSIESSEKKEFFVEDNLLVVYYRYGGQESSWEPTGIKLADDLEEYVSYKELSNALIDISMEYGLGSFKDQDRYLYVLDGKPFVLEKYKEERLLTEVNDWLAELNIPLEFGRSPERTSTPDIGLADL